MNPEKSKTFLRILSGVAAAWLMSGMLLFAQNPEARAAFLQVFLLTLADLMFLTLVFWTLFFTPPTRRDRAWRALIFLTFKLVCLAFLAITLKRLRNAPDQAALLGIGFMGFGPLISAVVYGAILRKHQ
jgi:multidrug transporter EmrE-like cation transporter